MALKLAWRPEVLAISPEMVAAKLESEACLADPTCRAEYLRGQGAPWFEQAIGTAFDILTPGLAGVVPDLPRGEPVVSGILNPYSLLPPELTARVGRMAAGHAFGPAVTGAAMNGFGFGDIFGDIGAFFTTEQTFLETLSNVGSDILGGVTSLIPQSLPALTTPLIQTLTPRPTQAQRLGLPAPAARPSLPELFLPEFMRPSQRTAAVPPGGGWPPGSWEADTYGEPGTFPYPGPEGGMKMAGAMVPAVRGMGSLALGATVNAMRTQGLNASVSWLVSVIKKFGPAAAVGFLASWVEDQIAHRAVLEAYGHKGRRMNPANTKALRRSLRRLASFDRLACRVQSQLYGGAAPRTRRRRCPRCRKNPCRCS